VLYVHGTIVGLVAYAERDEVARNVARLLSHVDYPMEENRLLSVAKPRKGGFRLQDLPAAGLPAGETSPAARSYWKRRVGIAVASLVPLIAVAILAGFAVGWVLVATLVASWAALMALILFLVRA
jgi:hypothetical protein